MMTTSLIAAGLLGAACLVATPAAAAPAAETSPASAQVAFRYHSSYTTQPECNAAGGAGSQRGNWGQWYCEAQPGYWNLFVDDYCRICFTKPAEAVRRTS